MRQILFKKYSKLQNFNETLYCGMTSLKNMHLNNFIQYHYKKLL